MTSPAVAQLPPPERPRSFRERLLTAEQLKTLPPPTYLIDAWLVINTVAVLFGKWGVGKSFVVLDWLLCVSTGLPWLGHEVMRGPVLYFAAEGAAGIGPRITAWEQDRCVKVSEFNCFPEPVNFLDQGQADEAVALADELQPLLIVIDTVNRSMAGGDENSSRDMGLVFETADRMRRATHATVVLVHHPGRDGAAPRGHSSLDGNVHTLIECTSGGGDVIRLKVNKQKDGLGVGASVRRVPVGDSCVIQCHDDRSSGSPSVQSEIDLLKAARHSCGSDGLTDSQLREVSGLPMRTYYRAKKALLERGALVNLGTGRTGRFIAVEEIESD